MMDRASRRKDRLAAAVIIALGIGVAVLGAGYHTGTLQAMGPGFLPVAFGVALIVVGLSIGLAGGLPEGSTTDLPEVAGPHAAPATAPAWRGWACILGGVAAFVLLGKYAGLVAASFCAVFVAALGDAANTWRTAAVLATVLTLFVVAVFHYGLHVELPLFGSD